MLKLRYVKVPSAGSQFRSRDLFPPAVAAVAHAAPDALGKAVPLEAIPDIPRGKIAYIDGFGNLKTTLSTAAWSPGVRLKVNIAGREQIATFVEESFGVPQGELALAKGSSDWSTPRGEVRWLELFLRGGSAAAAFGLPQVGDEIQLNA